MLAVNDTAMTCRATVATDFVSLSRVSNDRVGI
jgi:hypothetical protein